MRLLILLSYLLMMHTCFANTLEFPNACAYGDKITIAAVGDILLHNPLQRKGVKQGFKSLWQEALPYIESATFAYANLEGPIAANVNSNGSVIKANAWNADVYSSYPQFNYPPSLAKDLRDSGFDLVSTANNHALDRYSIGIDRTISALNQAGLKFCGTRVRSSNDSRVAIMEKGNWKVAWISCTEMTNGFNDRYRQVLYCYKSIDKNWIMNTIHDLKNKVDAIIISPHWGNEYQTYPTKTQQYFARQMLDAGATAVIGSHPHVLQPMEKYITKDGRATLIAYSLGNFVSYQGSMQTRSTIILLLGLTKTNQGVVINAVKYVPMYMINRNQQLYLSCLTKEKNQTAFDFITRILPSGNVLFTSGDSINNLQCGPSK